MDFRFIKDGTKLSLDKDVSKDRYLALNAAVVNPAGVLSLFAGHGYDLSVVPGAFLKIFTSDEKEMKELEDVLTEIDSLGLKAVFNLNLRVQTFKRVFLERVKYCLQNGLAYVTENNDFKRELYSDDFFQEYVKLAKPKVEKRVEQVQSSSKVEGLDEEDKAVKYDILKKLTDINQNAGDPSLTFIISTIMTNLDEVILKDNKGYRMLGTRHLVQDALQGVNLDSELEYLINEKVLGVFPDNNDLNKERGISA